MPATCCVIGCNNRHSSSKILRFYRIPRGKDQRYKFIRAISRHNNWEPNNSTRICSVHFETGAISKNKKDVDYAPTLYMDLGRDQNESDDMMVSLQDHMDISMETNETEFRDHITKLIDEASLMLKQREDNHLTQSLLFHDYVVVPHNSRPLPEYVDPAEEDCPPSAITKTLKPNCIGSEADWHQPGSQDLNSSSQNLCRGSLDVTMMMSSTSLRPNEDLEHFWVADVLLRMGASPTHIAPQRDNPLYTIEGTPKKDISTVTSTSLGAPVVRVVL